MPKKDSSVGPTPESDLFKYVLDNDINKIQTLVGTNSELIDKIYGFPYYKNILHLACFDEASKVNAATIDTLINLGANLNYFEESYDKNRALHFATKGLNPDILSIILNKLDENELNATNSGGNTAINLLIKEGFEKHDNYKICLNKLIDAGVDINITDNKGAPPIYWAAKKKKLNAIKILLKNSHLNLDSYANCGNTARDLITELNIDIPRYKHITNNPNELLDLFELVKTEDEDTFIKHTFDKNILDADNGNCTLLQLATQKCLTKIIRCLLDNNACPNKTTTASKKTPILMAAESGYYKVFELLVNHPNIDITTGVITELFSKIDYPPSSEIDFTKCWEYLKQAKNEDDLAFNEKDYRGNYPLHYAARYGGPDLVLDVLKAGASLANKNNEGDLTMDDIDYDTLKQHFDSCIIPDPDTKLDKENMTMLFHYKSLMPTLKTDLNTDDVEGNKKNKNYTLIPETDVICFMSKSNELKYLLKHPLITSFLYLKWQRISWVFYINLLMYLLFCISLICYILFAYEMYEDTYKLYWSGWGLFLLIFFILLTCRELFQVLVSPKTYFINFENWIEIALIIIVACMLFITNAKALAKTQFCAIVILLVAFEFIFLIGQHPLLSTNIVMLRTVSLNFFKFFVWYSILIIAFALSFYVLFNSSKQNVTDINTQNETDETNFFANPVIAVFKTVVMLTGEFDTGGMMFELYPITSHVIFISFVFTIAIILLNLLNGLAVSDTQEIKNDAELFGYIAQSEYVSYAEAMLLGSIIPSNLIRIFSCASKNIQSKTSIISSIGERVCLFPNFLKDYTLTIFPNQNGKIEFSGEIGCSCLPFCSSFCRCYHLDNKSVRMARTLINVKKDDAKRAKELEIRREKDDLILANQSIILQHLEKLNVIAT